MTRTIVISVRDRIAWQTNKVEYICGNGDFVVDFVFDSEWDSIETKTARFVHGDQYTDVVFDGNRCAVPKIFDTRKVKIGVYAGDLKTTTSAKVPCKRSILCDGGLPSDPTPDVYAQILKMLEDIGGVSPEDVEKAVTEYMAANPVTETDPTVPEWAKSKEKPSYTADEVGALSADTLPGAVNDALAQAKASGEFDGEPGEPGYTPQKGIDYYTPTDIAEMVNSVISALPVYDGEVAEV